MGTLGKLTTYEVYVRNVVLLQVCIISLLKAGTHGSTVHVFHEIFRAIYKNRNSFEFEMKKKFPSFHDSTMLCRKLNLTFYFILHRMPIITLYGGKMGLRMVED